MTSLIILVGVAVAGCLLYWLMRRSVEKHEDRAETVRRNLKDDKKP